MAISPTEECLKYLMKGLILKLKECFSLEREPTLVFTNSPLQYLAQVEGLRSESTAKYPYAYLKPLSIALRLDGYNPRTMQRDPRVMRGSGTSSDSDTFNVVPVTISLQFGYIDNNPINLLVFASKWASNVRGKAFNFGLKYHGVTMDIQIDVDQSIDIPEVDADASQQPSQGVALGNLTMQGYIVEEIVKYQPITGVDVSAVVDDNTAILTNGIVLEFQMNSEGEPVAIS